MRIALAQIATGTDPSSNLALVDEYTRRAADEGAQLVLFPEATMCRFGVPLGPVAENLDGPWATAVREIAARAGIVVVAGMFVPSEDGRVTNTLVATGPGVDAHYHKIHLYDAFGFAESRTVAPGFNPTTISVDGVTVGLTTCYDIRFPELYVELAGRGAQLITVHASWGSGPGKLEQWTLLARARALDTTGFVAAVDQCPRLLQPTPRRRRPTPSGATCPGQPSRRHPARLSTPPHRLRRTQSLGPPPNHQPRHPSSLTTYAPGMSSGSPP